MKSLSRVLLFATPWTVAYQAPLSMGFSRQEYWSGLSFPSPGIFPVQGLNLPLALTGGFFTASATWEAPEGCILPMLKALRGLDVKKPCDRVDTEVAKSVSPL